MKKISFGFSWCLLIAMVVFNSCTKDGPAGATGPAGPAGPAGTAGAAGPAGPAGAPGTANVIYSAWLDVTFRPDTVHNANGTIDTLGLGYYSIINAPKLTNDVLTNGEIKVYMNLGTATSPAVVPIPYFDGGIIINPFFFPTTIELDSNLPVSTTTNTTGAKTLQYRYILIPGGVPARSMINWKNYDEVKKYLNIKD